MMIKNKDIFEFLDEHFPLSTASEFDNPGFLVGDMKEDVQRVLLCLDCTLAAIERAKELGCSLMITHHPVIFEGLKSVTAGSIAYELIKSGISAISMHTNLDMAKGGVNDTLCEVLGLKDIALFEAENGFRLRSATSPIEDPDALALHIKERLGYNVRYVGGRPIKRLLICSGSGGEFLRDAIRCGADGLISADIKHNVFIEAQNADISVFDGGHYATENIIINPLKSLLCSTFPEVEFIEFNNDAIKCI